MMDERKVWALGGSFFLLGLLFGFVNLEGANERALRSQRVRSSRMARPDCDHELAGHSHDWFLGRSATNLSLQVAPDDGPSGSGAAGLCSTAFRLEPASLTIAFLKPLPRTPNIACDSPSHFARPPPAQL